MKVERYIYIITRGCYKNHHQFKKLKAYSSTKSERSFKMQH